MEDNLKPGYRPKTLSKHFYDEEIIGVYYENGRKVIYLKERISRLTHDPLIEKLEEDYYHFKQRIHDYIDKKERLYDEENNYN